MPDAHTPVLVVGAGPVGTTLAMDLARLGIRSIVVERRRGIPPNPKCNTTNARSMELFRRLDCADAIRDAGLPSDHTTDVVYMTRLNGAEIVRYERSTPDDVRAGTQHGVASDWPTPEPQHFISQIFLEPVLRRTATERWGVELWEGWELTGFSQDDQGVTAMVTDVDSGEVRAIEAAFLVGTDGAASDVRRTIGARLEGIPRLTDMCSTYFRSSRVSEIAEAMPGWMLRSAAGRAILVAIDGRDGWLIHVPVPDGEDPATWDPEGVMFAAVGEPFEYEVLDRSRWTPRAMVVDRWRDRNVFLAGDAAHLWVPMGGFGMNAGVADAISLSWRLAAALEGWGGDALLDSYQAERAPIGDAIAGQAVTWAINAGIHLSDDPEVLALLEGDGPDAAAARAELGELITRDILSEFECPGFQLGYVYGDSPVVCPDELTPPARHRGRDLHADLVAGGAPPPRVGGRRRVGVRPPRPGLHAAARRRGRPVRRCDGRGGRRPRRPAGGARRRRRRGRQHLGRRARSILVRPDQHVAWRARHATSRDHARAVLARAAGT